MYGKDAIVVRVRVGDQRLANQLWAAFLVRLPTYLIEEFRRLATYA